MPYVRGRTRDSTSRVVPLLLAAASASLLVVVWRRLAAPRRAGRGVHEPAPATPPASAEPDIGAQAIGPDLQPLEQGTGAIFHRRYDVVLHGVAHSRDGVSRLMQQHLAALAPALLARFEKTSGSDDLLRVGDEYDITMLGPWNGAVRVAACAPDAFTLITLDGHPEAGHITFGVADDASAPGAVRVTIESWARARDAAVAVAYGTLGIGKQVQTEVWITFLQRLASLAGADGTPEVRISTEQLEAAPAPAAAPGPDA